MRLTHGIAWATAASLSLSPVASAAPTTGDAVAPAPPKLPVAEAGAPPTVAAPPTESEAEEEPLSPEDKLFFERAGRAEAQYDEGKALMSEGRYEEAAAKFERSYASIEFGITLIRIIEAYDAANQPIAALKKARQYLDLPACEGGNENRDNRPCTQAQHVVQIQERSDQLSRVVGELKLQLADGVTLRAIRVADRTVPLRDFPLLVQPGSFVVELTGTKAGQQRSYDVTIEGGETFKVFVPAFPDSTNGGSIGGGDGSGDDRGRDDAFERDRRKRIVKGFFWGGVGATALSGIAVGVLGGLTLAAQRRYARDKCARECSEEEYNATPDDPMTPMDVHYPLTPQREFERLTPATNAMIGVTAALGVTTIVLALFAFSKKSNGTNARLQVRAGGLALRW